MHCSVIGTRHFNNRNILEDVLDVFYVEDPFICIRSGGTSRVSQWAEEWATMRGTDWNTRFEYWNKSDVDINFWLQCHADLLIDTDYGLVFWDGICQDTPLLNDIANKMHVPLITVVCGFDSNEFYIT